MKIKELVEKFSYEELVKTCAKKGWRIPSYSEIENQELKHKEFWISDTPLDTTIVDSHASINIMGSDGTNIVAHRNFILNAVVIVEEKTCIYRRRSNYGSYNTACKKLFTTFDGTAKQNGYIFCPYCGKSIEETD